MSTNIGKYRVFMDVAIKRSGKSQFEIAQACGFANANTISIIKAGRSHLSSEKVEPFAIATGINFNNFMMDYLEERDPVVHDFINRRDEALKSRIKELEAELAALKSKSTL